MKTEHPTEDQAIKNMERENKRMKKALNVARMAIDMCLDDLRRR